MTPQMLDQWREQRNRMAIRAMRKARSLMEIAQELRITRQTTSRMIDELLAAQLIHISKWREDARGRRTIALYRAGKGTNAPRPAPLTPAEKQQAYRDRAAMARASAPPPSPTTKPGRKTNGERHDTKAAVAAPRNSGRAGKANAGALGRGSQERGHGGA